MLVLILLVLILTWITCRHLGLQILGVYEIMEYTLLWICFLGTAWVLKIDRHVVLDVVVAKLKPRPKALLNIIVYSLGVICCLALAWYGLKFTWWAYQTGYTLPTFLQPPMFPIVFIIPVGGFLLTIEFLRKTRSYIIEWKESR